MNNPHKTIGLFKAFLPIRNGLWMKLQRVPSLAYIFSDPIPYSHQLIANGDSQDGKGYTPCIIFSLPSSLYSCNISISVQPKGLYTRVV